MRDTVNNTPPQNDPSKPPREGQLKYMERLGYKPAPEEIFNEVTASEKIKELRKAKGLPDQAAIPGRARMPTKGNYQTRNQNRQRPQQQRDSRFNIGERLDQRILAELNQKLVNLEDRVSKLEKPT